MAVVISQNDRIPNKIIFTGWRGGYPFEHRLHFWVYVQVLQNLPRGANGHLAAKHVTMETELGFDLVFHIATMLNQVTYQVLKFVKMAIVTPFLPFRHQQQWHQKQQPWLWCEAKVRFLRSKKKHEWHYRIYFKL